MPNIWLLLKGPLTILVYSNIKLRLKDSNITLQANVSLHSH